MNSLAALSDPTRQRIVEMLAGGALCAGDIAQQFELSPPAISQHLKALREAKLVKVRAEAQKRIYELDPDMNDDQRRALNVVLVREFATSLDIERQHALLRK